jgi:N-acetylmuramoyl-L-alanine amidase
MHPKDTRTPQQRQAMRTLVDHLRQQFPGVQVYGHRDFAAKACPCFDARQEFVGLTSATDADSVAAQ